MSSGFPGFPREGLDFLRKLKRNNRREWFQPRKHIYDQHVKAPMVELVSALNAAMVRFAPMYVNEPEDAIYRIYRDTRFSADKTPYKTHIAAVFPRRGLPKHACAGLYFSVSPEGVEVAGGVYMPTPEELRAIRNHLAANHEEFRRVARSRVLTEVLGELHGEQLARVPKGYAADDPAADLLRYKQLLYYVTLDGAISGTPEAYTEVLRRFKAVVPFCDFLNAPLVPAKRAATAQRTFLE